MEIAISSKNSEVKRKSRFIIITGLSCTGKTVLGKQIADSLNLLFLSRDSLKEILFDQLGFQDREWSKKIGQASYALLYHLIDKLLCNKIPFVVETNFKTKYDSPKLKALIDKYKPKVFQILFKADGQIIFDRFKQRSESGERHPGHCDYLNYEEYKDSLLKGREEPIDIPCTLIEIDTTDFSKVDINKIINKINAG